MNKQTWKMIVWGAGAVAVAVLSFTQGDAQAHTLTVVYPWCSPHNATTSNGGSVFTNCYPDATSKTKFHRDFRCDAGTPCANALCEGYKVISGNSWSDGSTSHGAKGGHSAYVSKKTLNCDF